MDKKTQKNKLSGIKEKAWTFLILKEEYNRIKNELDALKIDLIHWVEESPIIKGSKECREIYFKKGIILRISLSPTMTYDISPEKLIGKVGLAESIPCLGVKRNHVENLLVKTGKLSREDFNIISRPIFGKPKLIVELCPKKED